MERKCIDKRNLFSGHACGRIRKDDHSEDSMVIVVGGTMGLTGVPLATVELYDDVTDTWTYGPELPFGIGFTTLVEDPSGGVVLVSVSQHTV